jgi:hypothetical protein
MGPYRSFFYSNEGGELAHVHVRAGDREAKFGSMTWLLPLTPGFPRTKSEI